MLKVNFVKMFAVSWDDAGSEKTNWFAQGDDGYLYMRDNYGKWVRHSELPDWTESAQ